MMSVHNGHDIDGRRSTHADPATGALVDRAPSPSVPLEKVLMEEISHLRAKLAQRDDYAQWVIQSLGIIQSPAPHIGEGLPKPVLIDEPPHSDDLLWQCVGERVEETAETIRKLRPFVPHASPMQEGAIPVTRSRTSSTFVGSPKRLITNGPGAKPTFDEDDATPARERDGVVFVFAIDTNEEDGEVPGPKLIQSMSAVLSTVINTIV